MSLTVEVFDYLEEEQERRGLGTRQDTVEAIIRENMRRRHADDNTHADDEQEVEPPLAAAADDLRQSSTLLAVAGVASAGVAAFAGGVSWIAAAAVFLTAAVAGTALRFRVYREQAQEKDGNSEDENATDTAERDGDTSEVSTSSAPGGD